MGVYFRIVQEHLLFFLGAFARVFPEVVGGRCDEVLKISKVEAVLDIGQCEEAPSSLDLGVIPEEHMDEVPGEASVGCDKTKHVARREPRSAIEVDSSIVDCVVGVQDQALVVNSLVCRVCTCDVEKFLGQEGEILGMPDVSVV